jgi:mannose/fructose/N-acetylgalactosamine-specific phosphotransferase system component IID
MKLFGLIVAIVCSSMSLYFAIKGRILEAILFMTYAIYNKLDTKE